MTPEVAYLWIKTNIQALLFVLLAALLTYGYFKVTSAAYDRGYAAKEAEIDAAMAEKIVEIDALNAKLAQKDLETQLAIEEDRKQRPFRTQIVRERLQNAPEFSAVVRPRDIAACRLWQLCQIDSATTGGVQREWCDGVRDSCDGAFGQAR